MLAGMLADFGRTVKRFPGAAGKGLFAPPSTSTYCPRAPADKCVAVSVYALKGEGTPILYMSTQGTADPSLLAVSPVIKLLKSK